MREEFTGFYFPTPFWVGEALVWNDETYKVHSSVAPEDFYKRMREVAYRYDIERFRLHVCRDGMLMLQVSELEPRAEVRETSSGEAFVLWWARYLDYLNCFALLFESAVQTTGFPFRLAEVILQDVFTVQFTDGKRSGQSVAGSSVTLPIQMAGISECEEALSLYGHVLLGRKVIPKEVFDRAVEMFKTASADKNLVGMLAGITRSIAQYKLGNFSTSIVLSWFVIETYIHGKWADLLESKAGAASDDKKRINSKRRATLTGRDYPVSVISNFLELTDVLPFQTFERINLIRGYRNDIVHRDTKYSPEGEHCRQAINLAIELTLEDRDFTVAPNLGIGAAL